MNNKDKKMIIDKIAVRKKENDKEAFIWLLNNGPKSIFKYRSGIDILREKENLFSNSTWLSRASEFNDPYDCSFIVKALRNEDDEDIRDTDQLSFGLQRSICAGCFSSESKSILMWSHYANYHKGFCIEYNFEELFLATGILPVFYTNRIINPINSIKMEASQSKIAQMMLSKANEWSYEEEWRILKPIELKYKEDGNVKGMIIRIPKPIAIYLGCRTKENPELLKMLEEYSKIYNVRIHQMKIYRDKFGLYY